MESHVTAGINGWHFARHTVDCRQCDLAADAVPNGCGGLELHVDSSALCAKGADILGMREEGEPNVEKAEAN